MERLVIPVQSNSAVPQVIKAKPGTLHTILVDGQPTGGEAWAKTGKPSLHKVGKNLHIKVNGKTAMEIHDFYATQGATLEGEAWTSGLDQGLVQSSGGVSANPQVLASEISASGSATSATSATSANTVSATGAAEAGNAAGSSGQTVAGNAATTVAQAPAATSTLGTTLGASAGSSFGGLMSIAAPLSAVGVAASTMSSSSASTDQGGNGTSNGNSSGGNSSGGGTTLSGLELIKAWAAGGSTAPTLTDYGLVQGVTPPVSQAALDRFNTIAKSLGAGGVTSATSVATIYYLDQIDNWAADSSNLLNAPIADTYAKAGIAGVTTTNVGAVNAAIAAVGSGQADTPAEINALIASAIANKTVTRVKGMVVAGPVTGENDLIVNAYSGLDGKLLSSEPVKVNANGSFEMTLGEFEGPAIFVLASSQENIPDYLDEAFGEVVNLSGALSAMQVVRPGDQELNITPLSTLPAISLGVDMLGLNPQTLALLQANSASWNNISAEQVSAAIAKITQAFGLTEAEYQGSVNPVVTQGQNGSAVANALSNKYGVVLAALSGLDAADQGSVTQGLIELASRIETVAGSGGNSYALNAQGQAQILRGAEAASKVSQISLQDVAAILDPQASAAAQAIAQLDGATLSTLKPTVAAFLNASQMATLSVTDMASMNGEVLGVLSASAVAGWQQANPNENLYAVLQAANPGLISQMRASQHSAVLQAGGTMSTQMALELSPDAIQVLTPAFVAGLSTTDVQQFSAEQIRAMSVAQVQAFTVEQIQAMSSDQVALMRASQVMSLADPQFDALSANQLIAIAQHGGLNAISPSQLALVDALAIPEVPATRFVDLSDADIALLSKDQLVKLTGIQLDRLGVSGVSTALLDEVQAAFNTGITEAHVSGVQALQALAEPLVAAKNTAIAEVLAAVATEPSAISASVLAQLGVTEADFAVSSDTFAQMLNFVQQGLASAAPSTEAQVYSAIDALGRAWQVLSDTSTAAILSASDLDTLGFVDASRFNQTAIQNFIDQAMDAANPQTVAAKTLTGEAIRDLYNFVNAGVSGQLSATELLDLGFAKASDSNLDTYLPALKSAYQSGMSVSALQQSMASFGDTDTGSGGSGDTVAASLADATTNAAGDAVVLRYSEALADVTAAPEAFTVLVDGQARSVSAVTVSGSSLLLSLSGDAVSAGQSVSVAYTAPAADASANNAAVQDLSGNDAASFGSASVANGVGLPELQDVYTDFTGSRIALQFGGNLANQTAQLPPTTAFTVLVDGGAVPVRAVSVFNNSFILNLTTPIEPGQSVKVSYAAPAAVADTSNAALQDLSGADALSFGGLVVENLSDRTKPAFQSAAVNSTGDKIVLSYDENLNYMPPLANQFTVKVDGETYAVNRVEGSYTGLSKNFSLVFGSGQLIYPGQTVTVDYTPGPDTAGTSNRAIQDLAGNDALPMTNASVTNNSTAAMTGLAAIKAWAAGGTQAPTIDDYTQASGWMLMPSQPQVDRYNAIAKALGAGTITSAQDVTDKIPSLDRINLWAADSSLNRAPGLQDYINAGISGVTAENLKSVNAAIHAVGAGEADTPLEIAALVSPITSGAEGIDVSAPGFLSATTNTTGTQISLLYDENMYYNTADPSSFVVRIDGQVRGVSNVHVTDKLVNLTVSGAAIGMGQTVSVSYNAPAEDTSLNNPAVQDFVGNDAQTLTNTSVTNSSTVVLTGLPGIKLWAAGGTNPPTVNDYAEATNSALLLSQTEVGRYNAIAQSLGATGVTSVQDVQSKIPSLDRISQWADDSSSSLSSPSVSDFTNAGVAGVTTFNLESVNEAISAAVAGDADTKAEIETLIATALSTSQTALSSANVLAAWAADSSNPATAPLAQDYANIGIQLPDSILLASANAALETLTSLNVNTSLSIFRSNVYTTIGTSLQPVSYVLKMVEPADSKHAGWLTAGDLLTVEVTFDKPVLVNEIEPSWTISRYPHIYFTESVYQSNGLEFEMAVHASPETIPTYTLDLNWTVPNHIANKSGLSFLNSFSKGTLADFSGRPIFHELTGSVADDNPTLLVDSAAPEIDFSVANDNGVAGTKTINFTFNDTIQTLDLSKITIKDAGGTDITQSWTISATSGPDTLMPNVPDHYSFCEVTAPLGASVNFEAGAVTDFVGLSNPTYAYTVI